MGPAAWSGGFASMRESNPAMDKETAARLIRLPPDSRKRQMIIESFDCYSMSTVMLKILKAPDDIKAAIEAHIIEVLDDPTIDAS